LQPLCPQFTSLQTETLASSWYSRSLTGLNRGTGKELHTIFCPPDFRFEIVDRVMDGGKSKYSMQKPLIWTTQRSISEYGSLHDYKEISAKFLECPEIPIQPPPCLRIRAHLLDTVKTLLCMATKHRDFILPQELPEAFCNRDACSECLLRTFSTTDMNLASRYYQELGHIIYDSQAEAKHIEQQQREVFKNAMNGLEHSKKPFVTQSSMGFAQEWGHGKRIAIGDTIWALAGLAVPVVLRKIQDHYILISEGYLFRAALPFLCAYCGAEVRPWPMVTEVIDIW
jgi:hypothetical protein